MQFRETAPIPIPGGRGSCLAAAGGLFHLFRTVYWKRMVGDFSSLRLFCMLLSLLPITGCQNQTSSSGPSSSARPNQPDTSATDARAAASGLQAKIKFKNDAGDTVFSIKPESDGAKLVDSDEDEIARYNLHDSKMKIKDPDDTVLAYIIASAGRYKIEDSQQQTRLFQLQRQEDGDWKLEDGSGQSIYKIKKRDYGFEIEKKNDTSLYKVKLKEDKTSLRDSQERTVYSTKDPIASVAMTCLGFDVIDSLEIKAGLLTCLIIHGEN